MTKPSSKARLLLAEDHELVGQGLQAMLAADYDVLDIIPDGADVVDAVRRIKPDVLLLDLSLPNRTGIDLLPEVIKAYPKVRVLVLTMHVDPHLAEMAMKLGAAGFVPKNSGMEELHTAIEEVLAGRKYVSPKVPKRSFQRGISDPMGFSRLTPHQQKIVRMMGKGLCSDEIAAKIGVTVWTVNFHRKNIRKALGVKSDIEFQRYAILVGLNEENAKAKAKKSG